MNIKQASKVSVNASHLLASILFPSEATLPSSHTWILPPYPLALLLSILPKGLENRGMLFYVLLATVPLEQF